MCAPEQWAVTAAEVASAAEPAYSGPLSVLLPRASSSIHGSTASHTRSVLSLPPLASCRPSGLHATDTTQCEWPWDGGAVWAAQQRTQGQVVYRPHSHKLRRAGVTCTCRADMRMWHVQPGGCYGYELTSNVATQAPLATSHTRRVLSQLPLASCRPSGLHVTERTTSKCP
jgi:hypothetical protein